MTEQLILKEKKSALREIYWSLYLHRTSHNTRYNITSKRYVEMNLNVDKSHEFLYIECCW